MKVEFKHITTAEHVATYEASSKIFGGLLYEVRELSKKKPEATMSAGKVKIVNRVLKDLLTVLKDEPEGKYLEALDEEALPQLSDAVLVMVQFNTVIDNFADRYQNHVRGYGGKRWITKELIAELEQLPEPKDEFDE